MDDQLRALKAHVQKYREVEDKLRTLNAQIGELRGERRDVESDMGELLSRSEFQDFKQLENADICIRIQRPGEWVKPWSMSKADLLSGLTDFFENLETAEKCFEFLVKRQAPKLKSTEFAFELKIKTKK